MGQKVKHHHERKPKGNRNIVVLEMINNTNSVKFRHKNERRRLEKPKNWYKNIEE